jgi:hypothetical protein
MLMIGYLSSAGVNIPIPREYGGHIEINGWCHTFFQILPPASKEDLMESSQGTSSHAGRFLSAASFSCSVTSLKVPLSWRM